ncbi:MAG: S41 family peptidase [Candidatus Aminicenantes bacterium]|nr:S41 family peptidase [Candidatus Aminicenantes bacterium]
MKKIFFSVFLSLAVTCFLIPAEEKDYNNDWEYQLRKYAGIYSLIKNYYPGEMDVEKLIFASIEGFLKELDPHSYFLDPLSMRSMNEDQQGNYYGIGTRITKYEDRLTVVAPLEGSPAYKLGILVGDVVVEIDGQDTKDMSLDDAMKKLRGAKGTYVNIKIKREGVEKPIPFRIKRAEIPLDSISYAVIHPLHPHIGYISIRTFGGTTAEELKKSLDEMTNRQQMQALILDLRWNVGGSLFSAIDTADFFLKKGTPIVSIKGRNIKQDFVAKKNNRYEHLPLVILINRVSASASEILAAAVQDNRRAVVIGTRSWGKGLVQTVYKLSLNSSVALTTAKYYTPANRCLQRDFSKLDDYFSILTKEDYDFNDSIEGGVTPDIFIKSGTNSDLIVDFISKGIFFRFSRKLVDNNKRIAGDFKADEQVIKQFKHFLKENKFEYENDQFVRDLAAIQNRIEREVISNKFSISEGVKVFLEVDPVSRKAVEVLKKELDKGK